MTRFARTPSYLDDPDEDPDAPLRALALDGGGREPSPLAVAQAVSRYYSPDVLEPAREASAAINLANEQAQWAADADRLPVPPPDPEPPASAPPVRAAQPSAATQPVGQLAAKPSPAKVADSGEGLDEGMVWAALLDAFVNKGRGTPQIIARASEMADARGKNALERQFKQAQIDWYNRRGQENPELAAQRARRLDQGDRRLDMQEDAERRRVAADQLRQLAWETKNDPSGAQARKQWMYKNFPSMFKEGSLDGLSPEEMNHMGTQFGQMSDLALSPQQAQAAGDKAAAVAGAQADIKHAYAPQTAQDEANKAAAVMQAQIPLQREKSRETAAGTMEGQGDYRERRLRWEQTRAFAKDNEHELAIGGLINEINQAGGAAPADFAERFKGAITARGIDPARLQAWQAKQMVLEIWARKQTGAAISASEGEKFDIQTGMNATASPEQVEAAYAVMERLVQRQLRAQATNNPAAADVIFRSGVTDDPLGYLGMTESETQANAKKPVGPPGSYRQTAVAQPVYAEPPAAQPPAAAPKRPRRGPVTPEARAEAAAWRPPNAPPSGEVLSTTGRLPPASTTAAPPAAAPKLTPPKPGMVLMRNPDTGTTGWVDQAKVQDKINRLGYEVVQ